MSVYVVGGGVSRTLIDLCAASYRDELPLKAAWGPAAVPGPERALLLFATADAVVVRGVDPDSLLGWVPDADRAAIARSVRQGIEALDRLTDSSGRTLFEWLRARRGRMTVTGHSFGGTLAAAFAVSLAKRGIGKLNVVTFGAPSAGDAAFAEEFARLFPRALAYENTLDPIPRLWHDLQSIETIYPACPQMIARWIRARAPRSGAFVPVGKRVRLRGKLQGYRDWIAEAAHQHDAETYVELISAAPIALRRRRTA